MTPRAHLSTGIGPDDQTRVPDYFGRSFVGIVSAPVPVQTIPVPPLNGFTNTPLPQSFSFGVDAHGESDYDGETDHEPDSDGYYSDGVSIFDPDYLDRAFGPRLASIIREEVEEEGLQGPIPAFVGDLPNNNAMSEALSVIDDVTAAEDDDLQDNEVDGIMYDPVRGTFYSIVDLVPNDVTNPDLYTAVDNSDLPSICSLISDSQGRLRH
jgi:hypothetical protein